MIDRERELHPRELSILLFVCVAAGYNQGSLLPLLTVLLEKEGVSAGFNGLNSTGLYIGVFATMFFIRRPVSRFGYGPVIAFGLVTAAAATLAFPLWTHMGVWYALRLLVGVGDSALHYATQLWIVTASPEGRRGRTIALYGMCYGIGFSLGPLGLNALRFGTIAPFAIMACTMLAALWLVKGLRSARPEVDASPNAGRSSVPKVYRVAWLALVPSFLYGYMESSLNGSFPIYGLRIGFDASQVSFLLLAAGAGSLLLQLPLGTLSDRVGRKPVLLACALLGGCAFLATPLAGNNMWAAAMLFLAAGGFVGSFFSLGLAYAADLLPRSEMPTANMIATIHFSAGSIFGPYLGGLGIQYVSLSSLPVILGSLFVVFAAVGLGFRFGAKAGERTTAI
ncbi:MFS transporter [Paenibacillus sp. TRM 82003]|nr:MFS transporter [Paenibacillus sp. TRM 82003]